MFVATETGLQHPLFIIFAASTEMPNFLYISKSSGYHLMGLVRDQQLLVLSNEIAKIRFCITFTIPILLLLSPISFDTPVSHPFWFFAQ
jgi:hypothetical protein